ncbi:putative cytochrome P450 alkane hydroxylase [Tricladium varicosporioides]|nr:putative cytochrome P450 alkane hydroxylase [Hymenoscyphus varicosporioides]
MAYAVYSLGAVSILLAYYTIKRISTSLTNHKISTANNCEDPPKLPQPERILGFHLLREQFQASKSYTWLSTFQQRFESYGDTFSCIVLGKPWICTIEPENVKAILATNFKDYGVADGRDDAFAPLLGHGGIFTTDGKGWEHSRALIRPCFTRDQISDLESLEHHVSRLIGLLPKDKTIVDLQPLFFNLTMDSATEFLFGESVNSLLDNDTSRQGFATQFDYAQAFMVKRYRLGKLGRWFRNKKFDDACKMTQEFVDKYVQKAVESQQNPEFKQGSSEKERYVFLDELAKKTPDQDQLRTEVLNILLAGRDTTASLLSNTFHILAQRPDIWSKLRDEVDVLQGVKPTYETLKNLKYVKYIMNEALRLYPVIPANSRFALRPTILPTGGGPSGTSPIFVAAGTAVFYQPFAMHRRIDVFGADAKEFRPDRWETLRPGWAYLPFNGGPRICLGQQFALTEAGYTIVRFAQEFKSLEFKGSEWKERLGLSLASLDGVKVSLVSTH